MVVVRIYKDNILYKLRNKDWGLQMLVVIEVKCSHG
jgi:hypothetical protein